MMGNQEEKKMKNIRTKNVEEEKEKKTNLISINFFSMNKEMEEAKDSIIKDNDDGIHSLLFFLVRKFCPVISNVFCQFFSIQFN